MTTKCNHQFEEYIVAQHRCGGAISGVYLNDLIIYVCWACGLVKLHGSEGVGISRDLVLQSRDVEEHDYPKVRVHR